MTIKLLALAALTSISAIASAPIEKIPFAGHEAYIQKWRDENNAPEPFRLRGDETLTFTLGAARVPSAKGDVVLWVRPADQTITPGMVVLYHSLTAVVNQPIGTIIAREIKTVNPLVTTRGSQFKVPADKLVGVVKKVVRIN